MRKIDLDPLDRDGLVKSCKIVDSEMWKKYIKEDPREKSTIQLRNRIYEKVKPGENSWGEQYKNTLKFFDIKYDYNTSVEEMKEKLFEHRCEKIRERISDMDEEEKKTLASQLEDDLTDEKLELLKDASKKTRRAGMGGGAVLALQSGAITITGSNLGVCMLLTSGLSSVSSAVGVAFPFAAYTGAAALGGKALAVAGVLANPVVAVPAAAVAIGGAGYYGYKNHQNKQYTNLSGVNYLVESKKRLM